MGRGTAVLAIDIKGAFNALLSEVIMDQLRETVVPGRLVNFVSFMVSKRSLFFDASSGGGREYGVGVPKGVSCHPYSLGLP